MEVQQVLDAVNDLFAIYYAVFQGFCLQYFLGNYLEYRGKKSYLYKVCIVAAYAILSLFIGKLLPYGYGDIRILERQAVIFTMTALLAILFYRVKKANWSVFPLLILFAGIFPVITYGCVEAYTAITLFFILFQYYYLNLKLNKFDYFLLILISLFREEKFINE